MALILHIETATKICSVALSEKGNILQVISEEGEGFIHGERLSILIDLVMKNGNRDFKELQAVSISIGPGSYTGLRIGLSTVKGLVFALKCPIIALDTLEILAKSHANKGNIISMIDARRMEVYAFGIDGSKKSIFSSKPVILEAQTFSVFEPFLCIGDGALKTKEIWSGRAINYDDDFRLDASLQCKISYEKYLKKEFSSPEHLVPNYLKDFQLNKS